MSTATLDDANATPMVMSGATLRLEITDEL